MIRKSVVPAVLAVLMPLMAFSGATGSSAAPAAAPPAAPVLAVAQVSQMSSNVATLAVASMPRWSPSIYTTPQGATFNNPASTRAAARVNITRIVRMIDAVQGYRVRYPRLQCPKNPALWPNEIKIALYSYSEGVVTKALKRAHRRCVSVQVLMNDHLTNRMVPAFGKLQKALGSNPWARSWARRCSQGCRGYHGPLHTKMYLFSQNGWNSQTVAFGSSNMTGKAANVQWNDIYVFPSRPSLYNQFRAIFEEMRLDSPAPPPLERNEWDGDLFTMWWPQPGHTLETDRVLKVLKEVTCRVTRTDPSTGTPQTDPQTGKPVLDANGQPVIDPSTQQPYKDANGNPIWFPTGTSVSINIHAMEGDRGMYIAQYIVAMQKAGCNVRVLYGLIAPRIFDTFRNGGVPNRRTIFDRNRDNLTDMYTHMKAVTVNGVYLGQSGVQVTYTGSENFSPKTVGADEVWMKIPGPNAWVQYESLFNMIWNSTYYSAPDYKFYYQTDTPIFGRIPPGAIRVTRGDLEG